MSTEIAQLYGPGMSFYISQIVSSRKKVKSEEASLGNYCAALRWLCLTNQLLENKAKQLRSESFQLGLDAARLQKHMRAFHHELIVTWQADVLTRLVEVVYEIHGWKMPGVPLVGDYNDLNRETLTKIYTMAAKNIKKETVMKRAIGLTEQHHLALQRYGEVVHLRSCNPFRTECTFARWLVSKRMTRRGMYRFWERLFPLCYRRTVQESSEMF